MLNKKKLIVAEVKTVTIKTDGPPKRKGKRYPNQYTFSKENPSPAQFKPGNKAASGHGRPRVKRITEAYEQTLSDKVPRKWLRLWACHQLRMDTRGHKL